MSDARARALSRRAKQGDPDATASLHAAEARVVPSVESSWQRLERWFGEHAPEVLGALNPPASETTIARFERATAQTLPDDVRASFLIHDGQDENDLDVPGVVWGHPILSLDAALGLWRLDRQIEDGQEPSERLTSTPANAIRLLDVHRPWLPLSHDCGGARFGVDLDPGPEGRRGQVVTFGRDNDRYVIAWSWSRFLAGVASTLEAGNVRLTREDGGIVMRMRVPKRDHFHDAVAEVYRKQRRPTRR